MSSGEKRVIVSFDERAAPDDIVRLQDVAAQRLNDFLRYQLAGEVRGDWTQNPGLRAPFETLPSDPPADVQIAHTVLSGLMVRPDAVGFLHVDPGVAGFFVPGFAGLTADDSPFIVVDSAGVQDGTTLPFTANAGPGVRWDIVECQPAADAATETATRDQFDEGTQTFAPTSLPKVRRSVLTFRIRQGTAGGGVPDIASAWCPLAAVHVRTDSAGFSTTDVYDLRPLEVERCPWSMRHPLSAPAGGGRARSVVMEAELSPVSGSGINGRALGGYWRSQFGGYWSGGRIQKNLPAADTADFGDTTATGGSFNGLNLEDAKNRSAAFALAANTVMTVGAFFPRGYPRWVRYSQAALAISGTTRLRETAARYPQGPRGILMALAGEGGGGNVQRNGLIAPSTLPAAFGETVGAWGQVVGYAVVGTAGTDVYPGIGTSSDNQYRFQTVNADFAGTFTPAPDLTDLAFVNLPSFTLDAVGSPADAHSAFVNLVPGTSKIPMNAASVFLQLEATIPLHTGKFFTGVEVFAVYGGGLTVPLAVANSDTYNSTGGTKTLNQLFRVWVPLAPNATYDGASAGPTALAVRWLGDSAALDAPTIVGRLRGYQL